MACSGGWSALKARQEEPGPILVTSHESRGFSSERLGEVLRLRDRLVTLRRAFQSDPTLGEKSGVLPAQEAVELVEPSLQRAHVIAGAEVPFPIIPVTYPAAFIRSGKVVSEAGMPSAA